MKLVFNQDQAVAEWVKRRIEHVEEFGPCVAIGVADGDKPIAGAVYNMWVPQYKTMQISLAASTPRWAQRGIIKALLHYPFEQQGVRKLWAATASSNTHAMRFIKGVGFTQEAILSHQFGKEHAIITRMFDKDYRKRYGAQDETSRRAA